MTKTSLLLLVANLVCSPGCDGHVEATMIPDGAVPWAPGDAASPTPGDDDIPVAFGLSEVSLADSSIQLFSVPGAYGTDNITRQAFFRSLGGNWYIKGANGGSVVQWGEAGDIPTPAPYDMPISTNLSVFRPSTGMWFIRHDRIGAAPTQMQWGQSGDVPVPAFYDISGIANIAVYRPLNGYWYIRHDRIGIAPTATQWGQPGDIPVPAAYDIAGYSNIAVFRPSTSFWYIRHDRSLAPPTATQFGISGDVPVPSVDATGVGHIAVFRPSTNTVYVLNSDGTISSQFQGLHKAPPSFSASYYRLPSGSIVHALLPNNYCTMTGNLSGLLVDTTFAQTGLGSNYVNAGYCGGDLMPAGFYKTANGDTYYANGVGQFCATVQSIAGSTLSSITQLQYKSTYTGFCGGSKFPAGVYSLPWGTLIRSNGVSQYCSLNSNVLLTGNSIVNIPIPAIPPGNTDLGVCAGN